MDRLASNSLLKTVFTYLPASDVRNCLFVNKTFNSTIENNWRYLQRSAILLHIYRNRFEFSVRINIGNTTRYLIKITDTEVIFKDKSCTMLGRMLVCLRQGISTVPLPSTFQFPSSVDGFREILTLFMTRFHIATLSLACYPFMYLQYELECLYQCSKLTEIESVDFLEVPFCEVICRFAVAMNLRDVEAKWNTDLDESFFLIEPYTRLSSCTATDMPISIMDRILKDWSQQIFSVFYMTFTLRTNRPAITTDVFLEICESRQFKVAQKYVKVENRRQLWFILRSTTYDSNGPRLWEISVKINIGSTTCCVIIITDTAVMFEDATWTVPGRLRVCVRQGIPTVPLPFTFQFPSLADGLREILTIFMTRFHVTTLSLTCHLSMYRQDELECIQDCSKFSKIGNVDFLEIPFCDVISRFAVAMDLRDIKAKWNIDLDDSFFLLEPYKRIMSCTSNDMPIWIMDRILKEWSQEIFTTLDITFNLRANQPAVTPNVFRGLCSNHKIRVIESYTKIARPRPLGRGVDIGRELWFMLRRTTTASNGPGLRVAFGKPNVGSDIRIDTNLELL